jgi:hypothetical protein
MTIKERARQPVVAHNRLQNWWVRGCALARHNRHKRSGATCAVCGNAGTFQLVGKPAPKAVCAKCGHKATHTEMKEWLEVYFRPGT